MVAHADLKEKLTEEGRMLKITKLAFSEHEDKNVPLVACE
jgi:hypothetical protein